MHPASKPTSEEIAIAKWIKANVLCKKTKFLSHSVEYFTASKAVDKLLTSPWSTAGKNKEDPLFTTRESIVKYLDLLLRKKFFHRARKIPVSEQELKARAKKKEKKKEIESGKKDKSEAEDEKKGDDGESSHAEEKKEKVKKEKRKIRLDMHLEQIFVDGNDAYVWIYDPIPYYYWLAGGGVVLAAVALCLFPLWPPVVRKGVYYLSIGAAGFLMFIFGLAVLRVLVFCLLWLISMGRHHLWIFPNLTEDVGFFASFWPLWKYECRDKESSNKKSKKNNGKKKSSDDENEDKEEESGKEEESSKEDAQLENNDEDSAVSMLDNYVHLARDQGNNRTNNVETIFTTIGIAASLITIAEVINRRILPQPTTLLDTLDIVRRLEDLVIPDDGRQYKDAEDTILRGLYDMSVMTTNNSSEFQTLWWLDRARYLDGEIILLMEGLLGQQVAGSDLMDNIQDNLKCDAIQISEKLKRYNDLIESGSIAFNYFSGLGNMPAQ
uniref:Translocation protein SEC62 n=1 Tax=Daphnia pulicaria TaxID=35523 RepID=A0A4Y7MYR9_9CRUS|nr:EOG090X0D00 [Daphnia pulicaria]